MASVTMNNAAESFASQGIGSIFLYTHEAHPAENYPPLRSMAQKFKHAHALRDVYGVTRPILLDVLDGACHRAYGGYPNMTYIFSRSGQIMYKANWTDADSVVRAVEHLLDVQRRRKEGRERLGQFIVEKVEFRDNNNEGFMKGLERNGQQALDDWETAFD
jgi:hypothetical protein